MQDSKNRYFLRLAMTISFVDFNKISGRQNQPPEGRCHSLIRVQFFLVLTLILDKIGMVLTIVRVLFLIDWMYPASILPIAVSMIHLGLTRFEETPS